MTRTIVYIDGFNLYYRALKATPHKWLDLAALSKAVLPAGCRMDARSKSQLAGSKPDCASVICCDSRKILIWLP